MVDRSLARAQLFGLLEDKRITPACFAVGLVLLNRFVDKQGDAWPSLATLAGCCNCSVRTVSRAIARLKEVCWLSWRQRRDTWRRCRSNAYRVLAATVRGLVDKTQGKKPKRSLSATVSNGSRGALLGGVFARVEQLALGLIARQEGDGWP